LLFQILNLHRYTRSEKKAAVTAVIADLGLVSAADTVVGNETIRGISGGERKRVAIGMDLLHDPRLIFMDEPTSGLDAFQALNVMTTLKDLAVKRGRTIVASVHQPRSSIYALIDQLVLLSGGRLMYSGDGGTACSAHFAGLGEPVGLHSLPGVRLVTYSRLSDRSHTPGCQIGYILDHTGCLAVIY
jgi:ABC-type multidrug transport system ATPase subunit